MPEIADYINRVNEKLQLLLKRYDRLQKENRRMEEELTGIRKSMNEKSRYIEELEQRVEALKISKGNLTEEEKKATEKRIRHFLKEIDKCIAFLNG